MSDTLSTLRKSFAAICDKLATDCLFQTTPRHDGSPHVEIAGNTYSYVITERGSEQERRTTQSRDEILYWLVSDVVFSLAASYELKHRKAGQDSRRLFFARELELLSKVSADWAARKNAEFQAILALNPYRDRAGG
jgi:hypothetical protein